VLVVLYAILRFVFRNKLVMDLISGPQYVKVAHFDISLCVLYAACVRFMGTLFM
jgi:hypothetical protein